jgi:methylthioribose-1-phosphate isomerase
MSVHTLTLRLFLQRVKQLTDRVSLERGKLKLMMRLPQWRETIKLAQLSRPTIRNLFEAYDEASSALERMEAMKVQDLILLAEYRQICSDIENDVVELCSAHKLSRN